MNLAQLMQPLQARGRLLGALALAAVLSGAHASAADRTIHGVAIAPTRAVDGTPLVLNGAGTRRFMYVVDVYVAALYLPHHASSADDAMHMAGPKMLSMVLLRDVPGSELAEKLAAGIRDNVPASEAATLRPALDRLSGLFADHPTVRKGERVTLAEVPGRGTVVRIDGAEAGQAFPEPHFFSAMLAVWLGPKPADSGLKDALLGAGSS